MGIDPSAMVKLINELESAGLAKRRRRPGDRRAWEVSITPKGRRTLERARRFVTQVEDEVLSGLTDSIPLDDVFGQVDAAVQRVKTAITEKSADWEAKRFLELWHRKLRG